MASTSSAPVMEGVIAINKPQGLSSAQIIRDAQAAFKNSTFFAPWFKAEEERLQDLSHNQKQKRRSWKSKQPMDVKMGHGGTLDPMATGVLILGVGNGTKSLNTFLECTKSYETVVLFGAATDSYDAVGKLVATKDASHITRSGVEAALEKFRGKIMQKPPIFSALKVNGKKMYEYAREGKELPMEIEERPVEVKELVMTEWMEGGKHEWRYPEVEAAKEEKAVVNKALKLEEKGADTEAGAKRKRETDTKDDVETEGSEPSRKRTKSSPEPAVEPVMSGALPEGSNKNREPSSTTKDSREPCPAPACRLRMTVTSGFYVRSLAHDLGAAVDSLGLMSSLSRTRQGDFALGENVMEYDDLKQGEEVWGPKVEGMLEDWQSKQSTGGRKATGGGDKVTPRQGGMKQDGVKQGGKKSPRPKKRRNTSSPESDGADLAFHSTMLGAKGDDGGFF